MKRVHGDLRLGQMLINSIDPPLQAPEVFYMEDDEFLEKIGATEEVEEVCEECHCIPDAAGLCCYGCKYDGLPGKPMVRASRWVFPWAEDDPKGT